jgi:enoyl-CoA hydratase/carnithine racemase
MRQQDFRELTYGVADGVATVTFNRPARLNAFTSRLYEEIRWAMRLSEFDDSVEFVVLTGSGRAFATGGDLGDVLGTLERGGVFGLYDYFDKASFGDVFANPKITIAAINGYAIAGGLLMTAACDLSVAVESARLGYPEACHGIAGPWEPALNMYRVSMPRLKYLLFTGQQITATKAYEMGLINEVVPDGMLERRVQEMIAEMRKTTAPGRQHYKQFCNALTPIPTSIQRSQEAMAARETLDALRSFVHRDREPEAATNSDSSS